MNSIRTLICAIMLLVCNMVGAQADSPLVGKWRFVDYDYAGWDPDIVEMTWEFGDIMEFNGNGQYEIRSAQGRLLENGKWKIIRTDVVRLYDCVDYTDDNCEILPWNAYYLIEDNMLSLTIEFFSFQMFFERVDDGIGQAGVGEFADKDTRYELVDGNTLRITGMKGQSVSVYDLQGRVMATEIQTDGNTATISLQQLPQGVFVIKHSGKSVKFRKR